MLPLKNIVITILVFITPVSTEFQGVALAESGGLLDKAFFFRDISHFVDSFEKSPILRNRTVKQSFKSSCSYMNRVILPFYAGKARNTDSLIFNLYLNGNKKKPVFSTNIIIEDIP